MNAIKLLSSHGAAFAAALLLPFCLTCSAAANSTTGQVAPGTIGVNVSGAEYNPSYYATTSDLNYLQSEGVTLLRLPISWEIFQPAPDGPLDQTEVAHLENFIANAAAHGMQVIIDLHNYARYNTVANPASAGGDEGAVSRVRCFAD